MCVLFVFVSIVQQSFVRLNRVNAYIRRKTNADEHVVLATALWPIEKPLFDRSMSIIACQSSLQRSITSQLISSFQVASCTLYNKASSNRTCMILHDTKTKNILSIAAAVASHDFSLFSSRHNMSKQPECNVRVVHVCAICV